MVQLRVAKLTPAAFEAALISCVSYQRELLFEPTMLEL
ncbi:hypothetical protein PI124_g9201 [Phytophthora idaei]|nr:hypothetical protein PI125_g9109 [Phytophthora idaei]KAG3158431.1 hypothetical protein PI126_g7847 [Phytophthora idaei]KAG3246066.1 hypothetical protein PI124_g9201 [Phytophthora idaei]